MPDSLVTTESPANPGIIPDGFHIRQANFPAEITFHAPGLKRYKTSEFSGSMAEFVSVSVTGSACALSCEHCKTKVLHNMLDLPRFDGSFFELCEEVKGNGARGVLISGGSDLAGRVPLLKHIPDMIRVRRELGLVLRIHAGLLDDETCAALAEVDVDGVMMDIIGDQETITDVYHLNATPDDYEAVLERLERYHVPAIPHIIIGHYFGKMNGEWNALEMIQRHSPKILVLVLLMPLTGTPMASVEPPKLEEIGAFFQTARTALPATPVLLGCARPLGEIKVHIDRLAIDAGLNGVAYPAEGIVEYARQKGLEPKFINACCGVTW